jgi:NAD(P)-dependent dehydrogenase (short-subunit alcohol dehydrogenase family)
MSLVSMFKGNGPSGFGYGSTAEQVVADLDLHGKTYLVTGCAAGLGLETMRALGGRGAFVIATARTVERAETARASTGAEGTAIACDLAKPESVRACIAAVRASGRTLDAIIANAGVMALPKLELLHGIEAQFFTNHIGHFILMNGLLDALAADGRVVMVSSDAHKAAPRAGIELDNLDGAKGYGPWRAYGQAKLANLLFAKHLATRLAGTARTANALHPGVIATDLWRHMNPAARSLAALGKAVAFKTVAQGASTTCYVAAHPGAAGTSGEYFKDCNVATPSEHARDAGLAAQLWAASERIVAGL